MFNEAHENTFYFTQLRYDSIGKLQKYSKSGLKSFASLAPEL